MKIDVVNKLSTPGGFVRQMVRFPRGVDLTAVMEGSHQTSTFAIV
jgi:hypothetical protein